MALNKGLCLFDLVHSFAPRGALTCSVETSGIIYSIRGSLWDRCRAYPTMTSELRSNACDRESMGRMHRIEWAGHEWFMAPRRFPVRF